MIFNLFSNDLVYVSNIYPSYGLCIAGKIKTFTRTIFGPFVYNTIGQKSLLLQPIIRNVFFVEGHLQTWDDDFRKEILETMKTFSPKSKIYVKPRTFNAFEALQRVLFETISACDLATDFIVIHTYFVDKHIAWFTLRYFYNKLINIFSVYADFHFFLFLLTVMVTLSRKNFKMKKSFTL
jgi:hypothetical protein